MYGSSSDSNGDGNDNSLYKIEQSSLFELMTSYQLKEWNNIISKKKIVRGLYQCCPWDTGLRVILHSQPRAILYLIKYYYVIFNPL